MSTSGGAALRAHRVATGQRRGSSRPVVVETDDGPYLVKLTGAAQGAAALVAEVVVAELAEALGLRVPARAFVSLDADLECADRDPELLALLAASGGRNLGFRFLDGAREMRQDEAARAADDFACPVLWLDGLVMNADRTARNPNVVIWQAVPWLIDNGAS